jgi:hypothetical protein
MRSVLLCVAMAGALLVSVAPVHGQQLQGDPVVRAAIASVLDMDPGRDVERLPRIDLDPDRGDLTIVFAMRRPLSDDPRQIVASATDDIFTILWAAYTSGDGNRIRSATVLGTYAIVGRYERPREVPLMRAVLTANRASNFDWSQVASVDPSRVLDTWWVEGELQSAAAHAPVPAP